MGLLDGVLAVFQATSDVRMSNPKWSEIQILSILESLLELLFSTAVEINVWATAVFKCAFMKRTNLGLGTACCMEIDRSLDPVLRNSNTRLD